MSQYHDRSRSRSSAAALLWGLTHIALGAFACGGGSTSSEARLSLAVATEVSDASYRLSSATFEVTGGEDPLTLRTADAPDAPTLLQTLEPGAYTVELMPGWVLEREASSGFETVNDAALASDNPLQISLARGQLTRVGFEFQAGDVNVGFQSAPDEEGDDTYY